MKKQKLFSLIILFFSISQTSIGQYTFETRYDTLGIFYGNSLRETPDGGIVLVGGSFSLTGQRQSGIINTSSNGNIEWARLYGDSSFEAARGVELDSDSNYYVFSLKNFMTSHPEIWELKLNQNGDSISDKIITYRNSTLNPVYTKKNNLYGYSLSGNGFDTTTSNHFDYLMKLDEQGDTVWVKQFFQNSGQSFSLTSDEGYILAKTNLDLVKLDSSGNEIWTKSFTGQPTSCYSVIQNYEGNYVVAGSRIDSTSSQPGFYIGKTDSTGNIIWEKNPKPNSNAILYGVIQTPDSGFIFLGLLSYLADQYPVLIRTDKNGDTLWTKNFNSSGSYYRNVTSLISLSDGGLAFTGRVDIQTEAYAYIIRTDSTGGIVANTLIPDFSEPFQLFPNPVSTIIHVKNFSNRNDQITKVQILNSLGQTILEKRSNEINAGEIDLDVASIKNGIYFVKLTFKNGNAKSEKIIISR